MSNIYTPKKFSDGQVLYAEHINDIEDSLFQLSSRVFATPTITSPTAHSTLYIPLGQPIRFNVTFTGLIGQGTLQMVSSSNRSDIYSVQVSGAGATLKYKDAAELKDSGQTFSFKLIDGFGNEDTVSNIQIQVFNLSATLLPEENITYNSENILNSEDDIIYLTYQSSLIGAAYSLGYYDSKQIFHADIATGILADENTTIKLQQPIPNLRNSDNDTLQFHIQALLLTISWGGNTQSIELLYDYFSLPSNQQTYINIINREKLQTLTNNLYTNLSFQVYYTQGASNTTELAWQYGSASQSFVLTNLKNNELNFKEFLIQVDESEITDEPKGILSLTMGDTCERINFILNKQSAYIQTDLKYNLDLSVYNKNTEFPPGYSLISQETQIDFPLGGSYHTGGQKIPPYIQFNPQQTGVLNIKELNIQNNNFIVEVYFKANDIKVQCAPVLSIYDDKNQLVSRIEYNQVILSQFTDRKLDLEKKRNITALIPNEWKHVSIAFINEDNISEKVRKGKHVYINGVLSHYASPEISAFNSQALLSKIILNGEGNSQIAALRIYPYNGDHGITLKTTNFLSNYQSCIKDSDLLTALLAKEQNKTIGKYYFIANNYYPNPETVQNPQANQNVNKSNQWWTNFERLHAIEQKSYTSKGKSFGSKHECVNCTVFFEAPGGSQLYYLQDTEWKLVDNLSNTPYGLGNTDVFLQGTSSLAYPIKNFQLRHYSSATRKKAKFSPKLYSADGTASTWGWEADNQYTLKCDYMEQSHRNNTPTAEFYDQVLQTVVQEINPANDSIPQFSPPRQNNDELYRDTIAGFPCLVYYLDYNNSITSIESALKSATATGSYMFNLDKEAAALGFEFEDATGENKSSGQLGLITQEDYFIKPKFDSDFNITGYTFKYPREKEKFISLEQNPPQFNLFGYKQSSTILQNLGTVLVQYDTQNDTLELDINATLSDYFLVCFSIMSTDNIAYNESGQCSSIECEFNDSASSGFATGFFPLGSSGFGGDKLAFYKDTTSPRFSSYEDDEGLLSYYHLDQAIKFFEAVDNGLEHAIGSKGVQTLFSHLFDVNYSITYYLQMLMFAQVDSAGKNSMMDSWNLGKIYMRPYDMDTQMGLNNEGYEDIRVYTELNDNEANYLIDENERIPARNRNQYSTKHSRLWSFLHKYYYNEIAGAYQQLRSKIYTLDNIMSFVDSKTYDIISPSTYNNDGWDKYEFKAYDESECYYQCLAGDRRDEYYNFLKARLTFLDSYFELYHGSIETKMDASQSSADTAKEKFQVKLISETPLYIRVSIGQNSEITHTQFIDSDIEYTLNSDKSYGNIFIKTPAPCHLWKLNPNMSTGLAWTTKNVTLSQWQGAGGRSQSLQAFPLELNSFIDTENNNLSSQLNFQNSKNITTVDINTSSSQVVEEVVIPEGSPLTYLNVNGQNKLKQLVLKNLYALRTLVGAKQLTSLTELEINNCPALFNGAENNFITTTGVLIIDGDNDLINLQELKIENCNTLKTLIVSNLKVLEKLTVKNNINLEHIIISNNTKLTTVDMYTETPINVSTLYICSNPALRTLSIPLSNFSGYFYDKHPSEPSAHTGYGFFTIRNNPSLQKIHTSVSTIAEYTCDFTGVTFNDLAYMGTEAAQFSSQLSSARTNISKLFSKFKLSDHELFPLSLGRNTAIQVIQNLNFKGCPAEAFMRCTNLHTISHSNFQAKGSCATMFYYVGQSGKGMKLFDNCQFSAQTDSNGKKLITSLANFFHQGSTVGCQYVLNNSYSHFIRDIIVPQFVTNCPYLTSLENFASYNAHFKNEQNEYYSPANLNINTVFSGCIKLYNLSRSFSESTVNIPPIYGSINGTFSSNNCNTAETLNLSYAFHSMPTTTDNTKFSAFVIKSRFLGEVANINLTGTFYKTPVQFDSVDTLTSSNSISQGTITASYLFQSSTLQYRASSSQSYQTIPSTVIKTLMDGMNNRLKHATCMFYNSNITALPNEVFGTCPQLENAKGCFASCDSLMELIPGADSKYHLFSSANETSTLGLDLTGLFSNCYSLGANQNTIPVNIFDYKQQCIVSLGGGSVYASTGLHGGERPIYGAFANTAYTTLPTTWCGYGYWKDFTQLNNISYLFASNIGQTTSNPYYAIIHSPDFNRNVFTAEIAGNVFSQNAALTKVDGVFWGNNITFTANESTRLFHNQAAEKITSIKCLFAGHMKISAQNNILANLTNVKYCDYLFENVEFDTTSQEAAFDLLRSFNQLISAQGVFQSSNITKIPNNLFANKQYLQNASFAFANTSAFIENDEYDNVKTNEQKYELKSNEYLYCTTDQQQLYINGVAKNVISINQNLLSGTPQLAVVTDDNEEHLYTLTQGIKCEITMQSIDSSWPKDLTNCLLGIIQANGASDVFPQPQMHFEKNEQILKVDFKEANLSALIEFLYKPILAVYPQELTGVFYNCTALAHCDYLFYRSKFNSVVNGSTCLPQNLFYSQQPLTQLKSIASCFQDLETCPQAATIRVKNIRDTDNTYASLFAPNWFKSLIGLTNVSCLFANNKSFETNWNHSYSASITLPLAQETTLKNLTNFSGAFAGLGTTYDPTENTRITANFIPQDLIKPQTNINGMYMGTALTTINKPFENTNLPSRFKMNNLFTYSYVNIKGTQTEYLLPNIERYTQVLGSDAFKHEGLSPWGLTGPKDSNYSQGIPLGWGNYANSKWFEQYKSFLYIPYNGLDNVEGTSQYSEVQNVIKTYLIDNMRDTYPDKAISDSMITALVNSRNNSMITPSHY